VCCDIKTNITLSAITHTTVTKLFYPVVEITGSKLAGGHSRFSGGTAPLCPSPLATALDEGAKVAKWPISNSSAGMHVIKRLMVNYDTPRQYLNFKWTDFWYYFSFSVTWPSNLGCFTFGTRNFVVSYDESTGSHVCGLFINNFTRMHIPMTYTVSVTVTVTVTINGLVKLSAFNAQVHPSI